MNVIHPGRSYGLSAGIGLHFIQKGGAKLIRDGTTNEEVLEVLIHRVTEAYRTVPCEESIRALYLLHEALRVFRMRTARRVEARVEGTHQPHGPVAESAIGAPDPMIPFGPHGIQPAAG